MPAGAAAETRKRPSMEPFYLLASSEIGSLCVQIHRMVGAAEAGSASSDLPDAVARLGQLDPELATRLGEITARRLAAVATGAAESVADAASSAGEVDPQFRIRIARARAHIAKARQQDGLAPLRDALEWLDATPASPFGARHALAHALADYAAFSQDTEAAKLALAVVEGIAPDHGRDDVKGRVVRRLAMKSDVEATTRELAAIAAGAAAWDDPWEEAFTQIQLGLANALLGDEAAATRRWEKLERNLPSEAPLGPVGAVMVGMLFRARVQAGRGREAAVAVPVLEAEFRLATRDFAAALMETDGRDEERLDEATLDAMDDALTRMVVVCDSLILGGWMGGEASYLRTAQRLMDSLPSPHPVARAWLSFAQAWHAVGDERAAEQAWRTALLARGHDARTVGDVLREIVEAEIEIGLESGDEGRVGAAAQRVRKARGTSQDKERLMTHVLAFDIQTRLEDADGVSYLYD